LHVCNPDSEKEALPSAHLPYYDRAWMGDAWKAVAYFRSCRPDINIFVLAIESGLGILTKGKSDNLLPYSIKEIEDLSYRDLEKNRAEMLNLKDPAYLEEFLRKR
jgi:hypothetical protein